MHEFCSATEEKEWTSASLLVVPLLLLGMWGGFGQIGLLHIGVDVVAMAIVNTVSLGLILAWPKCWWQAGRASRGCCWWCCCC